MVRSGIDACLHALGHDYTGTNNQRGKSNTPAIHRHDLVVRVDPSSAARAGRVTPVVLPVLVLSVTLILLALCQETLAPRLPFPATVRATTQRVTSGPRFTRDLLNHRTVSVGKPGGPRSSREARGQRRDPLRHHRAVVGYDARTPWYIRVRSLLILILIVIGLGMAIAGFTLLVIASGRFLLEILAG